MLSPQLPSRFDPPCGAAQRFVPTVDSLPAQLLHGLQQPFFFLRGPTALVWLGRTKRTDFLIDSDQLLAEFLQAVKLGDFLLRFTESRRTGKSLGNGFAVDPAGEPNLGIVPGIIGLRTVTVGFAAATGDGGDGARAQITQREELLKELGAIRFQSSVSFR